MVSSLPAGTWVVLCGRRGVVGVARLVANSTVHRFKGGERDVVYVPRLNDGCNGWEKQRKGVSGWAPADDEEDGALWSD